MIYVILFFEFAKVGLFAVGGGLASLPFLEDLVAKYGWMTPERLLDMVAVAESTPGPIGINVATYIGFEVAGPLGAVVASVGETAPSIIIITVLARLLQTYYNHPRVQNAFRFVRPAVVGLIGAVALQFARMTFIPAASEAFGFNDGVSLIIFVLALFLLYERRWHPIAVLGIAAAAGMVLQL